MIPTLSTASTAARPCGSFPTVGTFFARFSKDWKITNEAQVSAFILLL
jgi:hypothetical protein